MLLYVRILYSHVCVICIFSHRIIVCSLPRPRRGLQGIVFTRSVCLCVCVCVSVCVSMCPANILVFYFSAIRRYIDLKFIQNAYRVVLNSLKKTDIHRSMVKITGTVHCFLKVQSYHKN